MTFTMTQAILPDSALVLVVVLPARRDLEIARLLGWYRIPMRSAPKVVDVDYLAFYQTAAFGKDHSWRIEQVAAVKGHELTTRGELFRDEPDHPRVKEEYYKIQLGELQPLPHSIQAEKWRRLTFLYTTGGRLASALTLHDLVVTADEREVLWRTLRERAGKAEKYQTGEKLPEIPEEALLAFFRLMQEDR